MVRYNKSHVKHYHDEEFDDYVSDDETIESEYTDITDSTDGDFEPEVWVILSKRRLFLSLIGRIHYIPCQFKS